MLCPNCANEKSFVVKTISELIVSRWRKCAKCGYTWTTEEKPKVDVDLFEYAKFLDEEKAKKQACVC